MSYIQKCIKNINLTQFEEAAIERPFPRMLKGQIWVSTMSRATKYTRP